MVIRRVAHITVLLLVMGTSVLPQEKEREPAKPLPQEKRLDIPVSPAEEKSTARQAEGQRVSQLPKIDLPEFVITGIASIDLPEAQKVASDENADRFPVFFADPVSVPRDRNTIHLAAREKLTVHILPAALSNGFVTASLGTYFTSNVGLALGELNPSYSYLAQGRYHSSRGYVPYANRSGGQLTVQGGLPVRSSSSWFEGARLGGKAGFGSETYRFFGSNTPSLTRTATSLSLEGSLMSRASRTFDYHADLRYSGLFLSDSSAQTRENHISLQAESRLRIAGLPLLARANLATASISGSTSGSPTYVGVGIGISRIWWGDFFTELSAHFYTARGMLGQKLARIYPRVMAGYVLLGNSVATVTYRAGVEEGTLSSLVNSNPYLSASALVQHTDVRVDVTGALETDWNDVWRSRISARYRSMGDFPLWAEGRQKGIWTTVYAGMTEITTYALDLFAKFERNGYFAASAAINSTRNTVTEQKIPYVADFEITGRYSREILRALTVTPWMQFVDRRRVDLLAGNKLPMYVVLGLRGEYRLLESLSLAVDVQNASDRRYEVWRGYQAEPFMVSAGASYRW